MIWRKRRYHCPVRSCTQKLFVERSEQISCGRRSTEWLRRVLTRADAQCRAYKVAAEYGYRGGW
jgi:hypothetical protein